MMERYRVPKRKPNWTDAEHTIILDAYEKHKAVLASRETSFLSCHEKSKCWMEITKQLNQLNPAVRRSVEEVKRKWHNLLGQGRRDFFDWKRAQQDPTLPPVVMPAISRRALELHGGFKFEDLQNRQDGEEFVFIDASSSDIVEDQVVDETTDAPDDITPEMMSTPPQDSVKEECPSPLVIEDSCEASSYSTSSIPNASPPPLPVPTQTAVFWTSTSSHPSMTPAPHIQSTAVTLHAAQASHATGLTTTGARNRFSPHLNSAPSNPSPHRLAAPTSGSLNHPSVTSPVSVATISHTSPGVGVPSSFVEPTSLLGQVTIQPSESARKKFRGSSQSERSERGTGLNAEREAELRIDILQLEKEKLWLETEKLRLEIDILRKQKQKMNSNF
ncbi:uncharacterized protein LOC110987092 [Acanthaster planci]|uniref:Uncharacterized protein LOC110987092 n=1 Tax=Acanthaster planci TaxID=133434 RepID=A0A8B7ZP91_ACAPL|nr:uncharacterized protein LOC110987092 [Acanthaster planci]